MVQEIEARDVADLLSANEPVYLLDVRQPWEHDLAAIPGSVLVPLGELATRAGEVQPAEGALVVVYCHHGIRSRSGAALLQRLGFPRVVSMAGGIAAWSADVDPGIPQY